MHAASGALPPSCLLNMRCLTQHTLHWVQCNYACWPPCHVMPNYTRCSFVGRVSLRLIVQQERVYEQVGSSEAHPVAHGDEFLPV